MSPHPQQLPPNHNLFSIPTSPAIDAPVLPLLFPLSPTDLLLPPMASDSSAASLALVHAVQEEIAPLPLIHCPRCNLGVTRWFISTTPMNPGRHFYKCEFHDQGRCRFWKWENKYIDYLRARWGHIFNNPNISHQQEETIQILRQIQSEQKIAMVLAVGTIAAIVMIMSAKF